MSGEEIVVSGTETPEGDSGTNIGELPAKTDEENAVAPEGEPVARETWGSQISYILTLVGYAVGFGNIWRFPYQVRENGGLAFLFPYTMMLAFVGVPTFFLELAVGQRRRKGIIYAWNEISPGFGGLGMACGWLCFMIGLYYNTLLVYCLTYMYDSFFSPLPWTNCKATAESIAGVNEKSEVERIHTECKDYFGEKSSKYYWFRGTLDVSEDIDSPGRYSIKLFIGHILAWAAVWLILWKGVKIVGKIVYFTAAFPYVVLIIFFIANFVIEPSRAWLGAWRLLKPDWSVLGSPITWLKAGSQIFFSLGLGLGCLVIFASYSPPRNNCFRDSIYISLINCGTSCFAALVVFPMIGALGYRNYESCVGIVQKTFPDVKFALDMNYDIYFNTTATSWGNKTACGTGSCYVGEINETNPLEVRLGYGELTDGKAERDDEKVFKIVGLNATNFKEPTKAFDAFMKGCSIGQEATASGGGTGFVFVGFTEAVKHLKYANFWSCLFFFMLILLGIDSAFGTVEGAVVAFDDITRMGRSWSTAIVCFTLGVLSLFLFPFGWGTYILDLMDQYTANWTLLTIALCECIAVAWVYGLAKIAYDVRLMTGSKPNLYILLCWKFITPAVIIALLLGSIVQFILDSKNGITYNVFQPTAKDAKAGDLTLPLPQHSLATGFILLIICMIWLPVHTVLRNTKYTMLRHDGPGDFPEEELREERNINVEKEEDQFSRTEKQLMGKHSLHSLQEYRDKTRSQTSLHKRNAGSTSSSGAVSLQSLS